MREVQLGKYKITKLICGGNPFSGFSHQNSKLDWEMISYYTMPNIQKALKECEKNGINTVQTRGDRHMMRAILEYKLNGGKLQWIAQIASEISDHKANVLEILRYEPIGIYYHGTYIDNFYHIGRIEDCRKIIEFIKEKDVLAGVGTHIPEVIEYCEEKNWPVDFYMACFYNLSKRGLKVSPALNINQTEDELYSEKDPIKMCKIIKSTQKTCIVFKVLGAGRKCKNKREIEETFKFAIENIKEKDIICVGHFQKYKNQIKENVKIVNKILNKLK